jgi:glycosyltransferase involved in cell wall biosynthesis
LRILQIAHCYYPPFLDCARQYAKLFEGTEHKVLTVYLTGEPNDEVAKASCSDEVIFLNYKSKEVRGLKLGAIRRIREIVSKEDFLFCITHRSKPTYIALLATKLPVISVHHNYGDFNRFSRRILVNLFRSRLLLLGVSNSVRDEMRHFLPHWPKDRIETLYNRIDIESTQASFVSKKQAREYLGIPQNYWVVGNVGRLHHDKDQATLIRGFKIALPKLPKNSLLVIMGSGPLESELKSLTQRLNLESHVKFTGNIPEGKKYFKAFDMFALTSDHEPFGMVLLEAMAAGLPIVCSNSGGGAEVVEGIGELFELGNELSLAETLIFTANKKIDQISILNKLHEWFSDQAGSKLFLNLLFVKKLLGIN